MLRAQMVSDSAAGLFLDFSNAFPSIAHVWFIAVLRRLRVPQNILNLIEALYKDVTALAVFAGVVVGSFQIVSGIKQGCPMSGSIFALGIDPLLRALASRLPGRWTTLNAYADDVSLVLTNVFLELGIVLDALVLWSRATAMTLNIRKCVLVPLWQHSERLRRWIRRAHPAFASAAISSFAKYLGVVLGPGALGHLWDGLECRFLTRAGEVRASDRGFTTKVRLFSTYCTSMLSHRLQFTPPTKSLRALYTKGAQRILAAPWQAIPHSLLTRLKDLKFPFEVTDIERLSLALRARLAASSSSLRPAGLLLDQIEDSDDRLLRPAFSDWRCRSMCHYLQEAYDHMLLLVSLLFCDFSKASFLEDFLAFLHLNLFL